MTALGYVALAVGLLFAISALAAVFAHTRVVAVVTFAFTAGLSFVTFAFFASTSVLSIIFFNFGVMAVVCAVFIAIVIRNKADLTRQENSAITTIANS